MDIMNITKIWDVNEMLIEGGAGREEGVLVKIGGAGKYNNYI